MNDKNVSRCMIITGIILAITPMGVQGINIPFDVNKVVEQVNDNFITSREGEFLIDTSFVYLYAKNEQGSPAVAFDGTNYLVVWEDNRCGSTDIYGTRVNQSGIVLDSAGIVISSAAGNQVSPDIAFDGANYCVVWQDYRNGAPDVYGVRVSQSGYILDTTDIAISIAGGDQNYPKIEFGGPDYLVVWEDERYFPWSDIYGTRITLEGIVIDTTGIIISMATDSQKNPSVAFDGTNYFVVWHDRRNGSGDIYGTRVSQSGTVLDPSGLPICTDPFNQTSPSIAFGDTIYFVVWTSSSADIHGVRITQTGFVIDTTKIIISNASLDQYRPAVAFDNANFLVSWTDMRNWTPFRTDIYGARVSQEGIVLEPSGILISGGDLYQNGPAIVFGDSNYLALWGDERDGSSVCGARITQSGVVIDTIRINVPTCANWQETPAVSFDGTNYLVAWSDYRNGSYYSIYASRVSPLGTILDTLATPISTMANSSSPSLTFGLNNHFVVWADCRNASISSWDIYGARVSQSGEVLDSVGIVISSTSNAEFDPAVIFGFNNYFVVWNCGGDIYGSRVNTSGVIIDTTPITISTALNRQETPAVSFDGTNYLVVWGDWRNDPLWFNEDIYGARVNQNGVVLDTVGIPISCEVWIQRYPSVAFDDTNYLVVWEDKRNNSNFDIYGTRISPSGAVLDPLGIAISTETGNQNHPVTIFDNENYFIVWHDTRTGSFSDIYCARMNPEGILVDSCFVSIQPQNQIHPAVVCGTGGQSLIVYSGWTDSINTRPVNIMRIWGTFYPFVEVEEDVELSKQVEDFSLQIYPNPAIKACNIKYTLSRKTDVSISLYDVTGRLVKEIINEKQNVGIYIETIDVTDLPQGVYFINLKTVNCLDTEKVILIK